MRKTSVLLALFAMLASLALIAQDRDHDRDADDRAPNRAQAVRITKGPIIEEVASDQAVIAWSTNVRASSVIRYGTGDEHLSQTAEVPYGGPTHRVHLRNLKPDTKYYFVVDSGQGKGTGTEAKSKEESFTTVAKGQKAKKYTPAGPGM